MGGFLRQLLVVSFSFPLVQWRRLGSIEWSSETSSPSSRRSKRLLAIWDLQISRSSAQLQRTVYLHVSVSPHCQVSSVFFCPTVPCLALQALLVGWYISTFFVVCGCPYPCPRPNVTQSLRVQCSHFLEFFYCIRPYLPLSAVTGRQHPLNLIASNTASLEITKWWTYGLTSFHLLPPLGTSSSCGKLSNGGSQKKRFHLFVCFLFFFYVKSH